jgi:hypothetical protein
LLRVSEVGLAMVLLAPISPGIPELIAAYTSYRNDCPF